MSFTDKELLEKYEDHYQTSEDKYSSNKTMFTEDTKFSHGQMWDAPTLSKRNQPGKERPCLVVNKTDPLVRRVVNEFMSQKVEIIVKAVGDTSDPLAALALSSAIRNIEKSCQASTSYRWMFDCSTRGGVGYLRVDDEYMRGETFDHQIFIRSIKNPNIVSFCPDSQMITGADAYNVSLKEEISKSAAMRKGITEKEIQKLSPNEKVWKTINNKFEAVEYFYCDESTTKFILLDDGMQLKESAVAGFLQGTGMTEEEFKSKIIEQRALKSNKVYQTFLVHGKIISEPVLLNTQYIPIVRCVGRECLLGEELDYRGLVRNSKDANRMYNIMSSLLIERIGLATRAPVIGAQGQFEGFEDEWKEANNSNVPFLEYVPIAVQGTLAAAPARVDVTTTDPGIERYLMIASEDLKSTSALFDASMGATSNELTGKAINARASLGSMATSDFSVNALVSLEHVGRILTDMIPKVLKPKQIADMIGDDYSAVRVDGTSLEIRDKKGRTSKIDIYSSRYDVEISARANDLSRREATVEALGNLAQKSEKNSMLLADVIVSNLDIKDADKIANRFKSQLPPDVIAAEEGLEQDNPELDALQKHSEQIIGQMKANEQQMQMELTQLRTEVKNREQEFELKQQEIDLKEREVELKEKEAMLNTASGAIPENAITMLLQQVSELEQNFDDVEEQLEMITNVLEQQTSAGTGPTPPPEPPSTMESSLQPAADEPFEEVAPQEENVGVPNE